MDREDVLSLWEGVLCTDGTLRLGGVRVALADGGILHVNQLRLKIVQAVIRPAEGVVDLDVRGEAASASLLPCVLTPSNVEALIEAQPHGKESQPESEPVDELRLIAGGTIGGRLRSLLKHRDVTIASVSRGSGVCYATLTNILGDRVIPQRRTLESIASCLGVDAEWLRRGMNGCSHNGGDA